MCWQFEFDVGFMIVLFFILLLSAFQLYRQLLIAFHTEKYAQTSSFSKLCHLLSFWCSLCFEISQILIVSYYYRDGATLDSMFPVIAIQFLLASPIADMGIYSSLAAVIYLQIQTVIYFLTRIRTRT